MAKYKKTKNTNTNKRTTYTKTQKILNIQKYTKDIQKHKKYIECKKKQKTQTN